MRSLRLPFVVTVASASLSTACGGLAVVEPEGTSSGGGGSTSTSVTSGSGSGSSSSNSSGPTGTPVDCPASAPSGYDPCTSSSTCTFEVVCQSGPVVLAFTCGESGYWELAPDACALPYDSCPGTDYYCDSHWSMPTGTNPPSPCPSTPPPEGEPCFAGGMGGVWEHCGYHCAPGGPGTPWTVASCTGAWSYDGACSGG